MPEKDTYRRFEIHSRLASAQLSGVSAASGLLGKPGSYQELLGVVI